MIYIGSLCVWCLYENTLIKGKTWVVSMILADWAAQWSD